MSDLRMPPNVDRLPGGSPAQPPAACGCGSSCSCGCQSGSSCNCGGSC
ncbi:hypothetical protein GQS52_10825 [Streptomyces sp. SCUT-3]|nr:hypothetical protein GQS52_10825 [Streptomyces sp. SCUT-3]